MIKIGTYTITFALFASFLTSCHSNKPGDESGNRMKYDQYMFQGEQLYQMHCLNCHQKDGSGLGKLIPPLTSDFLKTDKEIVICGIKHGLQGPMVVNGIEYDGVMPNNPRLTPLEIAEILTYINNSWGNDYGMATIPEVKKALENCN